MLSRVAERLYWMGRYLERVENSARLLNVYSLLLLDLPRGVGIQWSQLPEITGTADSTPAIGRHEGLRDVISSDPKFQVIFSQDGDFMLSKGREIMQHVLKRYDPKSIDVLYSHNDDMTFGAIEVMQEAGIEPGKDIVIISVDATQRIINYLKDGSVNCVIECNPNSGPQVMELARKITAGETVRKQIYIDENVFDEDTDFGTIAERGY